MGRYASLKNLFDYSDYRLYLRDIYHEAKKARASFSFRIFSKKAGFQSPNFYKLVMEGKRNLTAESLSRFMTGLDLNKQERQYFSALVRFNQSKVHHEKNEAYRKLLHSRKFRTLKPTAKHEFKYCSEWYHAVVRELIASPSFDGTAQWIAERIFPPVSAKEVEKSLALLEKLGFIGRDEKDRLVQKENVVSTGAEATSLALFNYHLNLLDLTKKALENIPAPRRDISSMTLGVARSSLPLLKKKIQEFREDILRTVSRETQTEEVVQLSIHFFPVTRENNIKMEP